MSTSVSAPSLPITSSTKTVGLLAVFAIAVMFVAIYVFHYYLHYDPVGLRGYWPKRFWLLLHISTGMVALLTGPWQFSRRLRQRNLALHRNVGRVYLIAIALGALASFRLAFTTNDGWAWGFGVAMLGVAWVTTAGMAYYAVLLRQIAVHKEWMVRSYVVTFAFVTFRFLFDMGPTSRLQPEGDRAVTLIWASWVLPLLATEVIMQVKRLKSNGVASRAQ